MGKTWLNFATFHTCSKKQHLIKSSSHTWLYWVFLEGMHLTRAQSWAVLYSFSSPPSPDSVSLPVSVQQTGGLSDLSALLQACAVISVTKIDWQPFCSWANSTPLNQRLWFLLTSPSCLQAWNVWGNYEMRRWRIRCVGRRVAPAPRNNASSPTTSYLLFNFSADRRWRVSSNWWQRGDEKVH